MANVAEALKATNPNVSEVDLEKQQLVMNSVLIRLSYGVFGNSKKSDADVQTEGDKSRFRVSKTLLDSPELRAVTSADNKIRQFMYKECIQFDMGVLLLAAKKLPAVVAKLELYKKIERPVLVKALADVYTQRVKEAEEALGPNDFNPSEFPPLAELLSQFYFDYKVCSFHVPGELKSINAEIYQAEVEKAQAQIKTVSHEIQQAQRTLLYALVDNLDARLSGGTVDGKKKVLNQGAVDKLQKFLADFSLENITGDKQMEAITADLQALVAGVDVKELKKTPDIQAALASKTVSILSKLEDMVEVKPERRFKFDEDEVANGQ